MPNDIVPFDPSKIADALRDRIRMEVINLIPPDAWKQMIEREIKAFTTSTVEGSGYNERRVDSGLRKLVHQALTTEIEKQLKEYFCSPDWGTYCNDNIHNPAGEKLYELIKKSTPQLMEAFFGQIIVRTLQSLKNGY